MCKYRYLLIWLDVAANTVASLFKESILILLYVHLIQNLSLLLSLLIILLQFFHEDILHARILRKVLRTYWSLLATSLIYICLTVSWQILNITVYRKDSSYWLIKLVHCLAHRFLAVQYYFALAKPILPKIEWFLLKEPSSNLANQDANKI